MCSGRTFLGITKVSSSVSVAFSLPSFVYCFLKQRWLSYIHTFPVGSVSFEGDYFFFPDGDCDPPGTRQDHIGGTLLPTSASDQDILSSQRRKGGGAIFSLLKVQR